MSTAVEGLQIFRGEAKGCCTVFNCLAVFVEIFLSGGTILVECSTLSDSSRWTLFKCLCVTFNSLGVAPNLEIFVTTIL